jgi:hypothetical protein
MYTWDFLAQAAHYPVIPKQAAAYRHLPGGAFALAFPDDHITSAGWHAYLYIRPEATPTVGRIAFLWRPATLSPYLPSFTVQIRSQHDRSEVHSDLTIDPSSLGIYFSWPASWLPDTWLDISLIRHGTAPDDTLPGDALILSGFLGGYPAGDSPITEKEIT